MKRLTELISVKYRGGNGKAVICEVGLVFRGCEPLYKKYLQQEINENEFKSRLDSMTAKLCPRFKKRAMIYGIDGRYIDVLLADIREDLLFQFERWTNDEYLTFVEMKSKSLLREVGPEHRNGSPKLLKRMSDAGFPDSLRMGEMILRVLEGRCSKEETEFIKMLQRVESCMELSPNHCNNEPADGLYLNSSGRIRVFLTDGSTWEDFRYILQHELTHFLIHESCFNTIIKNWPVLQSTYLTEDELENIFLENVRSVISCLFTGKALKMEKVEEFLRRKLPLEIKPSQEKIFKKAVCEESIDSVLSYIKDIDELDAMKDALVAQNLTFSLCNILDESLAYLSERYTGRTYDAEKLASLHSTVADAEDFGKMYLLLESITADMDEEDFDRFAKELCDGFLCAWKPFWGTEEYKAAADNVLCSGIISAECEYHKNQQ
ncbi:MAG: hypothetical protein SCH66_08010 [Methanolobus sp.]|nr:hypothetical protein [Methanolobus sp.]